LWKDSPKIGKTSSTELPESKTHVISDARAQIPIMEFTKRLDRPNGPYFIDLFAGCGGLSLGLENAGFCPVFVSELNHHAMATYLTNRTWTHGHLKEPGFHCFDIKNLVLPRGALPALCRRISSRFGIEPRDGELDLVVGGPPCQGFSSVGHRRSYSVDKSRLPSNHLYQDMLFVISKLRPKMFLFENVRGLLTARWSKNGRPGEIWDEILNTYADSLSEYRIEWTVVHAKEYGVPQNRPRVLLVGIRADIATTIDLETEGRAGGLLPNPTNSAPTLMEVLGDLVDPEYAPGMRETAVYPNRATSGFQRQLRWDPITGDLRPKGFPVSEQVYSQHSSRIVEKFEYMITHGGDIPTEFRTRKFNQRLLPRTWGNGGPSITATSLPDDYVHFSQPRSLTVREWARLQTFPDWYEFKGKRTTGGLLRAGNPLQGNHDRELPRYTQIGNAVPVKMAQAIGDHFRLLLKSTKQKSYRKRAS
jgi:DNA (cytosine-5)-methyltransferase 1